MPSQLIPPNYKNVKPYLVKWGTKSGNSATFISYLAYELHFLPIAPPDVRPWPQFVKHFQPPYISQAGCLSGKLIYAGFSHHRSYWCLNKWASMKAKLRHKLWRLFGGSWANRSWQCTRGPFAPSYLIPSPNCNTVRRECARTLGASVWLEKPLHSLGRRTCQLVRGGVSDSLVSWRRLSFPQSDRLPFLWLFYCRPSFGIKRFADVPARPVERLFLRKGGVSSVLTT